MAYVPNAADISQPTGDKYVSSAAPEFRALKVEALSTLIALNGFQAQLNAILAGIGAGDNSAALAANLAAITGSSLIGWSQTGVGAIYRTELIKLREAWVTPQDFGAIADGVTDCTVAINKAIATGKCVELPEGAYVISSALTPLISAQEVRGRGQDASIILVSGSGYDVFTLQGRACIQDLQITTTTNVFRTAGRHVVIVGGNQAAVRKCTLLYAYEAIVITSGIICFIADLQIRDFKFGGIRIDFGFDFYISNITADNVGAQPSYGLKIISVGGLHVTSADFIHCGTGIVFQPSVAQVIQWLFFDRVQSDTCINEGWLFDVTAAGSVIQGGEFISCWSASSTLNGINIAGSGGLIDGLEFIGHRSLTNGLHGLICQSTVCKNLKIHGGYFTNNSISAVNTYNGIEIGVGVNDFSLIGVKSGQALGLGATQAKGINIEPGASNRYTITGCDLFGNILALSDGGTGLNKVIQQNLASNPFPLTSIAVGASPFSYVNNIGGPAIVLITGGTISSITIQGVAVPIGAGQFTVPQARTITVTYSVLPTMQYLGVN